MEEQLTTTALLLHATGHNSVATGALRVVYSFQPAIASLDYSRGYVEQWRTRWAPSSLPGASTAAYNSAGWIRLFLRQIPIDVLIVPRGACRHCHKVCYCSGLWQWKAEEHFPLGSSHSNLSGFHQAGQQGHASSRRHRPGCHPPVPRVSPNAAPRMDDGSDEMEELDQSSIDDPPPPNHRVRKQPSLTPSASASPRPTRSYDSLAQSFQASIHHPADPSRHHEPQPAASTSSHPHWHHEGLAPPANPPGPAADNCRTPQPIHLQNDWPPAPYGPENLPRDSFEAHHQRPRKNSVPTQPREKTSGDPFPSSPANSYILRELSAHGGQGQNQWENHHQLAPHRAPPPPSVTLTLLDNWSNPNIHWQTKLKSFGATLFINLFLPFMNGVMLGFGEIAAKEILGSFFGWGPSAHRYRSTDRDAPYTSWSSYLTRAPRAASDTPDSPSHAGPSDHPSTC